MVFGIAHQSAICIAVQGTGDSSVGIVNRLDMREVVVRFPVQARD
jgi:hypothetical protein